MNTNLPPRISAYWILGLLCLVSFGLMMQASFHDSAVVDERAHIPAGYGYVHELDYRLNPEHPPLVKIVSAIPLLFVAPTFPTQISAWQNDINAQWVMGTEFLYHAGNNANTIIRLARMGPILITILLILFVYFWAQGLMGPLWALLPATLTALSPIILAHGHYVTTDVGAALGVAISAYTCIQFLFQPTKKRFWLAAVAFGVAMLLKFSTVLLIPYAIILALLVALLEIRRASTGKFVAYIKRASVRAGGMALVMIGGFLVVVYPIYFITTVRYPIEKQVSDTTTILASFADGPTQAGAHCKPMRCLAEVDIWMSKNVITRPYAEYVLGVLMVIQRSSGGNTGYFLGEVSATGSHLYFPIVYALKEPLPILLLIFCAVFWAIQKMWRRTRARNGKVINDILDYAQINFPEIAMMLFVVIYWAWSMKSPLNIGVRHLLPTLPFIYILAATGWKHWIEHHESEGIARALKLTSKYFFLFALIVWLGLETAFAAPYFLSYFNQLGGGISAGYRSVTDSNYDWGQDLLALQQFVSAHPEIDHIGVDYFGGGDPKYYLGDKEVDWWSARGTPTTENIHWLAVSINTLEDAIGKTAPGFERKPEDEYRWLRGLKPAISTTDQIPAPDFRVGTSIFIYKL